MIPLIALISNILKEKTILNSMKSADIIAGIQRDQTGMMWNRTMNNVSFGTTRVNFAGSSQLGVLAGLTLGIYPFLIF